MILNLKCLATPYDCPVCNTLAIPILYIAPPPSPFLVDLAKSGIITLSELPDPQPPIIPGWSCPKCFANFGTVLTLEQWDKYLDPFVELRIF